MRCLILGGDGMLGHQLLKSWQGRHDVRVTLHGPLTGHVGPASRAGPGAGAARLAAPTSTGHAAQGLFTAKNTYDNVDVRNSDRLRAVLEQFRPQAVINAVGIIKQQTASKEVLPTLEVNAVFPHRLRLLCQEARDRLVQVSTDCVFNGRRGGYTERDPADAEDVYGLSKFLGEVSEYPAITLRSSIIGLELSRKKSLIEWFLSEAKNRQTGDLPNVIKGYTHAIYSGLTTCEMARVMELVLLEQPRLSGVWHVASQPISKFDLLSNLAGLLGWRDVKIVPDDTFCCDRSLCGDAFSRQTGYRAPSWNRMLGELATQIPGRVIEMRRRELILQDKRILVTGGTGSLGKTLVRRLLSGELGTPEKVIILSRDEAKQHEMRLSYLHRRVTTDEVIYRNFLHRLEFRLGDVRRYPDVCSAIRDAHVVINAAALKQVPNCEYFPDQAILTNCIGPMNIVRAIREQGLPVETVVGISTDKACKPVNVMGMTKAIHERIFTSANILNPRTRFICSRYGNVLASRGSVIPLFHEQIKQGGPVTVTVPEMTRFLMSLEEAVDCVFEALCTAAPGETFVPRTPAATILDLAKALIGHRKIKIEITGIRPGEKLHEIMISEEECHHTLCRGDYFAIRAMLPELQTAALAQSVGLTKEFSSADTVIGLEETTALLEKHGLLVGQVKLAAGLELFEAKAA